jgi:UDP-3-O-[3-hydroxymyristoyl] glucosamine N-acyltransferase
VEVANPTLAFSAVIAHFGIAKIVAQPGIHPTAVIAPTAKLNPQAVHVGPHVVVEDGAQIGDGSVLHAGSYIGHHVHLGEGCVLHPHAIVKDYCTLGKRVIIHSGAVIGSDGFGYEFVQGRHMKVDQVGIVEVGDDVEIGSCSCIDRARFGSTSIGSGTKIDNLVQVAHNVTTGAHCILVAQVGVSGSTKLGNYVIMGGQSGAAGHLKIGDQVTVLGRSGVTKDLPAKGHYTGFPARPLMEGRKLMAYPAKVPDLQKRILDLERRLAELESKL